MWYKCQWNNSLSKSKLNYILFIVSVSECTVGSENCESVCCSPISVVSIMFTGLSHTKTPELFNFYFCF